ncbi:MAG: 2-oxoacid:ferredoxin oxidoreductase subunit beta [Bacillota bacterium]
MNKHLEYYFRTEHLPHIWCPGCGNGIVTASIIRAVDSLGWSKDDTVFVSGIGCSSRASGYLDFNTLHTTHGRALVFATGIKMSRPDLNVVVITGDGDASAIGGNHLIHAARRNIDITTICFNNSIYGMTGGQYSPLTPTDSMASTAPYGNTDRSFDLCRLTEAAGASYVARGTTYHITQLDKVIERGLQKSGFSFIEAVVGCPVYYGRRNDMRTGVDILNWQKEAAVTVRRAEKMEPEELEGKIVIGTFIDEDMPEYTESYQRLIEEHTSDRSGT